MPWSHLGGSVQQGADHYRAITCWWRRWSSRVRACSMSAAPTARSAAPAGGKPKDVDARGIELSREKRQPAA
jgi:hypothetical protein